jgi:hypothetical protein
MNNAQLRLPAVMNERLLLIADYQRPYAWERKQLQDLWDDLDLLGTGRSHYAGTLVLRDIRHGDVPRTSMADDGTTLRHCEVVDGQQRLTTCLLLIDRVRRRLDALAQHDVEHAAAMATTLRANYGLVSIDNAQHPRLRLGAGLNDYWVNVSLGNGHPDGQSLIAGERRLRDCATYFDEKLDGLADADPAVEFGRLKDLQGRITSGLGFLVHEVASAAEVGVIFETLNERGRPLSELEKTKNYLLYLARNIQDGRADELSELINTSWATIFVNLAGQGRDAEDQLLRAHWLATRDPDRRTWQQIASVKSAFERSQYVSGATRLVPPMEAQSDQCAAWDRLYGDLTRFVKDLRKCSFFLREMFDESAAFESFGAGQDDARRASGSLLRSGVVAPYRPLLFAARLRYPADGEFYARLVRVCERYSARVFVIRQRRLNAGESRLLRLAHDLYRTPGDEDRRNWVLHELSGLIWRYASDSEVRASLETAEENWYVRRGHKYFLYEYELSLRKHGQELPPLATFVTGSGEQRTTEHILPQHPKLEATCWWDAFSTEEHAVLQHSLGNLVLTYENSVYSNRCFVEKRGAALEPGGEPERCYAQAELMQERELAAVEAWTPEEIRNRQARLTEWAMTRWAVERPASETMTEDVDIEAEDDGLEPQVAG